MVGLETTYTGLEKQLNIQARYDFIPVSVSQQFSISIRTVAEVIVLVNQNTLLVVRPTIFLHVTMKKLSLKKLKAHPRRMLRRDQKQRKAQRRWQLFKGYAS